MFDPKKLLDDLLGTQVPGTGSTVRDKVSQAGQMAKDNPRWFAEISNVHHTGALPPAQIEESLSEYVAIYGEDLGRAQFQQTQQRVQSGQQH